MLVLFHIYTFLSNLGPETCVVPLIHTYLLSLYFSLLSFLYVVCVLIVVLSLFSMNCVARIEDLSWASKLVKFSRCGLGDRFVRAGLILKLYNLNRRSSSGLAVGLCRLFCLSFFDSWGCMACFR